MYDYTIKMYVMYIRTVVLIMEYSAYGSDFLMMVIYVCTVESLNEGHFGTAFLSFVRTLSSLGD